MNRSLRPQPFETEDLLMQGRAGDPRALDAVFERVAERLLIFLRARMTAEMKTTLDPMDILQEVYMRAIKALPTFTATRPGSFSSWLFQVADNTAIDLSRRAGAKKRLPAGGFARGSGVLALIRGSLTNPDSAVIRDEEGERMAKTLEELDDPWKEILLLRHFQELTLEQIAEKIGTSRSSAHRMVARAEFEFASRIDPGC